MRLSKMSALVATTILVAAATPVMATPALLPKKDTFTAEDLNERGKWLLAEKDKQK